jgi:hypothetical protein
MVHIADNEFSYQSPKLPLQVGAAPVRSADEIPRFNGQTFHHVRMYHLPPL